MADDPGKAQKEAVQAYQDVFNTPQGRIVLMDMIKVSGIYQITGVREGAELQHMEGSRDMVRRIISILALNEEKLTQLAIGDD